MQKFDLSLWLQDKSRKVTTRYGDRKVRIICTDRKDKRPIVALMVDMDDGSEYITSHSINGWIDDEEKYPDKRDLFFADEEEKLTEFEKEVAEAYEWAKTTEREDFVNEFAPKLLDLAINELRKEEQEKLGTLEMPIDTTNPHYIKGKQDALKDLESLIEDKVAEKFAELFGKLLMQPNPNQPNPFQPISVLYGCPADFPNKTYGTKTQQDNE